MAAPKKKPITVGKGTSYTRPTADGRPRPVSAKPSQASKVRAAKKTTSSGITRRPDGKIQPEGRAARSKVSQAKVTQSGGGTPGSAKVTMGRGGRMSMVGAASRAGMVARRAGLAGVAAEGLTARNTAAGTLSAAMKRGDYKPKQGPAPKTTQTSFNKKSFDQAFKAARTSGAKQFTWRGKKYTTTMKGE